MTLTLTVDGAAWRARVAKAAAAYDPLVPVVKGNGYGFGRATLARTATELLQAGVASGFDPTIAVGTVHELAGLPGGPRRLVLGPIAAADAHLLDDTAPAPIVTVGSRRDLEALGAWRGAAVVKLESSMRRFGVPPDGVADLNAACASERFDFAGFGLHLPLAGTDADRFAETEAWVTRLETLDVTERTMWVSHLGPEAHRALRDGHRTWRFPMRAGTALWLGDKSELQLGAEVMVVRQIAAGDVAGYRGTPAPAAGSLAVVGAGTAHGVVPLDDGRSPFHYRRRRLDLLERPHMHTSTLFLRDGDPVPHVGEQVDVQRPLTMVTIDRVAWT